MSKAYQQKTLVEAFSRTSPEMRTFCQRPGKTDENGQIQYFTEQNHKSECDVNIIVKKYNKTGLITHVSEIEAKYGDMTGKDFKDSLNKIIEMQNDFDKLPAKIRKEFDNTPEKLLTFMENPANREKAIELGLIKQQWTPETDGLGEHILKGENKNSSPKPDPDTDSEKNSKPPV